MANWTGSSKNDTKNGTSGADHLSGLKGNDTLNGGEGNDTLVGGAGNDILNGGTGIDTAVFNGKRSDFRITTLNGITTVQDLRRGGPEGTDTLTNIEKLVFSDMTVDLTPNRLPTISKISAGTATEDDARQTIDLLKGASDADGDALSVVAGSVKAVSSNTGRTVAITLDGNNLSIDPAQFGDLDAGKQETVTVTYTITDGRGTPMTNTATLTITGAYDAPVPPAPVTWTGSSKNDTKNGTSGADHLSGLKGNDKLYGREGNDTLVGGAGNDVLDGGTGIDTAVFNGKRSDFRITTFAGITTVQDLRRGGPEGTDLVTNVEKLVFSDMTVDLTPNRLPTISKISAGTVSEDDARQTIDLLAGASDADGDALSVVAGSVKAVSSNTGRTVAATLDGNKLSIDPAQFGDLDAGKQETVTVTYTITDGRGTPVTNTATLIITGAYDGGLQTVSDPARLSEIVGSDQMDTVVYTGSAPVGSISQPFVLPDGVENFQVEGSSPLTIKGNSLNNHFGLGSAKEDNVDLSAGGSDTVAGTADELDGATITGFGTDDKLVVGGAATVKIVKVTAGSAILDLDTNGDGLADATVRLEGEGLDGSKLNANDFKITSGADGSIITFLPTNDSPVAKDGTAEGDEDAAAITGTVVATDAEGDELTYTLVENVSAEEGALTFNADGSYSFVPAKDFNGEVRFTYKANDGAVDSNIATVTIAVAAVNDAPVAMGGDALGDEGTTITGQVGGTDIEGAALTYRLVAPVEGLTFEADGSYSYVAPKNAAGTVTFDYVVNDGELDSAPKSVIITIGAVNDAPVAEDSTVGGEEDAAAISGTVAATDADGDTLTYAIHGETPEGLTFNADGTYSFIPAKDFNGTVEFQFVAKDGKVDSAPATVTLSVVAVNDAPVATGGDASGDEGTIITGQVGGTDVEGAALTYSLVAPVPGLTFEADGSYSYVAPKNASASVTFDYIVNDGVLDSAPKSVTITIGAVNDAPVAEDGTAEGGEDAAAITGTVAATDADGDGLTYSLVEDVDPAQGALTFNADGSYSFVPAKDFNGTVEFQFVASDGQSDSVPATVTITVAAVNDAPVATGGNASGDEGTTITGQVGGTDVEGSALTYSLVAPVEGLTFTADGSYSYVAPKNAAGQVTFDYIANDGELDSAPKSVTITIGAVNDAPVAENGTAEGEEDAAAITGTVVATDADGDALTYSLVEDVDLAQGMLTFNADGSYSFVPAKDFNGEVRFTYKANDGGVDSNIASVTITVAPADDVPPVVSIADATVSEAAGQIEIPVTLSHASREDVTLTYEVSAPGKTISFDGLEEGGLPANHEGVRWTGILSHGNGSAIVATEGGQFQSLDPAGFTLTGLTLTSDYLNQLGGQHSVTIQAYKDGVVVGTQTVTLTNGAPSVPVTFGSDFAGIDAVRIDAAEGMSSGSSYDAPVRIDNVVLAGSQPVTGTVTIGAGQTTGSITIPVANDSVYEVGEKIVVRLTGADGAILDEDVEAVGTIENDDAHPLPLVSIVNFVECWAEEGGLGVWFELTRDSRIDEELTVQFESEVFGDFEVTFAPGSDRVEFIELSLEDDGVDLGTRPYEIRIKDSPNYIPSGKTSLTGTAVDNDGNSPPEAYDLSFSIDEDTLAAEGFEFNGQGYDNQQWSLSYEIVEQPTAWGTVELTDMDYGSGPLFKFTPHAGVLEHLNDGQTQNITFKYVANDGAGGISAPATVTIKVGGISDDYVAPTISVGDVTVSDSPSEDGSGKQAIVKITLSAPSVRDVAVSYVMVDGTAKAYEDYSPASWTAYIPAGQTEIEISIPIWEDSDIEGNEAFTVVLSKPVNATILDGEATVTITDGEQGNGEEPTDQTITASTTATEFAGGGGNDTLLFAAIPAGSTQLLGGTVSNAMISLGEAIVGTPYAGKMISDIENLTFENIAGVAGRTLTINGDAEDNAITVIRTVRKTDINGGDGNDTIDFTGATNATSESHNSVISGGAGNDTIRVTGAVTIDDRAGSAASGNDTYMLGAGKQELRLGAGNGNDTIRNFSLADDVLNFAAAGIDASTVTEKEINGDTVFTIGGSSTVTVEGVTGMQFGTHWTATGDYMPPAEEEPTGEPGIIIEQTGGSTHVVEGGATDTITIALASAPMADVTVVVSGDYFQVASNPDDPYGEFHLTFTPDNWNIPQTVTVTAIDDADEILGNGSLYISTLESDDPRYSYFYPANGMVSVSVTDNDAADTGNTPPSALNVAKDTYDTDLSLDVEGFGYDAESGFTYEILTQPKEGTVTLNADGSFHFEGNPSFLEALKRGEIKPVTFQYRVSDGELTSEPATISINVHGTNPGDETIQAFTRTTPSQTDFFPLDGKDGNDTVVFNSVTLTSGTGLEISLGDTIKWTEYAGKALVNIENITIKDTNGNLLRTMTVGGDAQANVITIENTNHKLSILGRGGNDTINFKGTGNGLNSVINGGAGDDTVNAYSTVTVNVADGNDTVNVFNGSNVTVQNFTQGDKINFGAGVETSNVSATVQGSNTVFTINQGGVTSTVTVVGASNLVAGTDWTAGGSGEPAPVEPAVINAQAATAEVTEGGLATFTFTRTGDLSQPLTVSIDTSIGTAVPGRDFTAPTTITFAAGSDTATLQVQTIDDGQAEEPATIEVRIMPGNGYTVGEADGNVTDLLDSPATEPEPILPSLSINDVTTSESVGTASFTVTLSAAAAEAVSVAYATAPAVGSSGVFLPISGTLTFAPGETTKTIEVPITDNTSVATGPQKFVVNLSNVSANATLADLVGEGTIIDDDLPSEMPALTIATTTGLDEHSTISWNAIPGAASYVLIGIEPDEPNFPPHTLGFAVAPSTSFFINGNDEFTGMVVTVQARDANGSVITRSENQTDLIANVNDVPTGRPVISDNTPEVGQLLTISIGDLEDGDGMRADRPDEFGYIWQRSTDGGVTWNLVGSGDAYTVTEADAGHLVRGAAQYADRGDTLETVYSLTTAPVNDPNPDTPPVAFDDSAETPVGKAVSIDVRANDFDFEGDATIIASHGQGRNGTVSVQDGKLLYTPNASFVGIDSFEYTLNGGDTAKVTVTVTQEAQPLTLLTVDGLDENSTLSWTAVPGAVSYVLIGLEPDDPTAPPHELGFALAPNTSFNINGDDEFAGMAIHVEARDANGVVITRSVNETGLIANINDIPTGNLGLSDMTPEVGQVLSLDYGTFEDGDGYRDRGRAEEFEWAFERSSDGMTWTTIVTGASAGKDGPFGFSYTVTQADNGYFLRGRAIYEDRAGDTIETVYSLATSRVGATQPGNGSGGDDGDGGEVVEPSSLIVTKIGDAVTATELGANGSFTVALAEAPSADVIVTLTGDNQVYGQAADGSMELVFTPENWNTAQTVEVVAVEDGMEEGPHTGGVWLDTISDDPRFNGLMEQQAVNVIDSAPEPEEPPYVTMANLGGDVTEGGEMTFTFHRSGGTKDLAILWERVGGTIDADDIAAIRWNGVEGGYEGFKGFAQTATMTIVLRDDSTVEDTETVGTVRVLPSSLYMYDDPFEATGNVLDNDVAPANTKPVVGDTTVNLSEDEMTARITPVVTDADGNATTISAVGTLPAYVTFDAASQSFLFSGEVSAFDHLNEGETETITFEFVANDGTEDSDPGTVTITINGITDPVSPQIDPEPAQFADPYNYDMGNGGPAGQRTAGDDILNDAAGLASTINGFGGHDTIYGRDLNDSLIGGNGNDTIYGGTGDDSINGDGGGTGTLNAGAAGADLLYGGDGNDTISGQDGNDILVGGHGADILNGGLGDDTFVFHDIFDRGDTVTMQGQGAANDVFDFRSFDFDPNSVAIQGAVDGLKFVNAAPSAGFMAEDTFYYDAATGRLSLNTGGDGLEDFFVTLLVGTGSPLPRINADDFLI